MSGAGWFMVVFGLLVGQPVWIIVGIVLIVLDD